MAKSVLALAYGTLARLAAGILLSGAAHAVDCTAPYVTEAAARCSSEAAPCMLIAWFMNGMPAQCRLVGSALEWWVGVPSAGTTIDASTGQLVIVYTYQPLAQWLRAPSAPTGITVN